MKEKNLSKLMGLALNDYDMIKGGDRIVVGLSGGMDSLALLLLLHGRLSRIPVKYELFPAFVDNYNGENNDYNRKIKELEKCIIEKTGLSMDILRTGTVETLTGENALKRGDTCFICARKRRNELIRYADKMGCSRIALGHHLDDIVETSLMNIFYTRELSSMLPRLDIFGGRFSIIRPLCYIRKVQIENFIYSRNETLPVFGEVCPARMLQRDLRREKIRKIINGLSREIPSLENNVFAAFRKPKYNYLLDMFFNPKSSGLFRRP